MTRWTDIFLRPFPSLQEVMGGPGCPLPPPCLAFPWPPLPAGAARGRPRVLVSGTGLGPPIPGLPGTGPSPAPSQSPSRHSRLLPLPALCSWCRRCAGQAKRLGSGSSLALAALWPHTAAQDREGEIEVRSHLGQVPGHILSLSLYPQSLWPFEPQSFTSCQVLAIPLPSCS